MADFALFRDVMRAAALGDAERANQLDNRIEDADRSSYDIFVTAMFCGAVAHRFENDQSREAISRFVDEMRYDYRNAQPPVKPMAMEGTIRAVFGEEHLLDEIDGAEQLRHQFLAIRKIVHQSESMKSNLDGYLSDAEKLAREWMSA